LYRNAIPASQISYVGQEDFGAFMLRRETLRKPLLDSSEQTTTYRVLDATLTKGVCLGASFSDDDAKFYQPVLGIDLSYAALLKGTGFLKKTWRPYGPEMGGKRSAGRTHVSGRFR
jgi:hypothetical protein